MHTPNRSEFAECKAKAADIVSALKATTWNVAAPLQNTSFASVRLAGVSITLNAVLGVYNNLQLICGSSGICISIPNQKVIPSRVTLTELKNLERVIFGVIVHECTHVIQEKAAPAAFATAFALEQKLLALGTSAQPNDWYDLYIGQPFEQEARAGQAAAEVEDLGGQNLAKSNFYTFLTATEVFQRTATKIGAPGSGGTKIASWWEMWMALAWDAYA